MGEEIKFQSNSKNMAGVEDATDGSGESTIKVQETEKQELPQSPSEPTDSEHKRSKPKKHSSRKLLPSRPRSGSDSPKRKSSKKVSRRSSSTDILGVEPSSPKKKSSSSSKRSGSVHRSRKKSNTSTESETSEEPQMELTSPKKKSSSKRSSSTKRPSRRKSSAMPAPPESSESGIPDAPFIEQASPQKKSSSKRSSSTKRPSRRKSSTINKPSESSESGSPEGPLSPRKESSSKRSGSTKRPSRRKSSATSKSSQVAGDAAASPLSPTKKSKKSSSTSRKSSSSRAVSRGRSSRRPSAEEEESPNAERRSRGGSRKPMKCSKEAHEKEENDKGRSRSSSLTPMKKSIPAELDDSVGGDVKKELQAFLGVQQAKRKAPRRGSTGSHFHLTEEERTITEPLVAPPTTAPTVASPIAKIKKPTVAAATIKIPLNKKVWFANEDTTTYRTNEHMDEEDVKTLWFDHYDLQNFKDETHEAVENILEGSNGEAEEWRQQVERVFDVSAAASEEQQVLQVAETAMSALKLVYEKCLELVGVEHLFVDRIKYDGNRRRGTVLDLIDKIQNERYFRRRLSGRGPDHSDERARLSYECTQTSRPSRFFSHGIALARFALEASDE